ncbi:hypothetical protein AAFF_G00219020 [Aldrovandia affinis]|uniref:Uncharacterized protein n=1 Tax=Aldrovandia affinis TaxID=143900 RepID=A0AAD7WUT9_9TELE|nr:hypothetical protein AAFF_G00219020 [Aldrovandia affinis]
MGISSRLLLLKNCNVFLHRVELDFYYRCAAASRLNHSAATNTGVSSHCIPSDCSLHLLRWILTLIEWFFEGHSQAIDFAVELFLWSGGHTIDFLIKRLQLLH